MSAEQISNKGFFVRAEEELIAACSFSRTLRDPGLGLEASSRK
jgi:hypothetical protein